MSWTHELIDGWILLGGILKGGVVQWGDVYCLLSLLAFGGGGGGLGGKGEVGEVYCHRFFFCGGGSV